MDDSRKNSAMGNKNELEETITPEVISSYIPDFSDMSDENSEFWDFLKTKENIKGNPREKNSSFEKTHTLSDFLIYPSKTQSEVILPESTNDLYLNDSGISLNDERKKLSTISENEFCLEACGKSESFEVSNDKTKLKRFEETDDEFWEFLGSSTKTCTEYELPHTRKKKSNISKNSQDYEDQFWDFLKIGSPETEDVISFKEFLARNNTHSKNVIDINVSPSQSSVENDLNLKIQSSYSDSGRANSLSDLTMLSIDTGSISSESMKISDSNKESLYDSGIKLRELSEHHFNKNSTEEEIFSVQAKAVANVENNTSLTSKAVISYPEMHDVWREERGKKHSLEQDLRNILPATKISRDVASEVQTIKTTSSFDRSDFVERMKLSNTSSTNSCNVLHTTSQVLNTKEYQCSNSVFTVPSNNLNVKGDERILTGISALLQSPYTELLSKESNENTKTRDDNLPCISSVISIPSFLDWAESFNQNCEVPKLGHLTKLESQKNLCLRDADKIQVSPKHSTYISKECKKRRLSSSPIGCSQFKISDSSGIEFEKTYVEIQTSGEKKQKLNLGQITALDSDSKTLPEQTLPCISKCYLSNSMQSTKGNILPEPKSANSVITSNQNNSLPLYLILPQTVNGQSSNVTHLFMILQNNDSNTGNAINVSNQISQTTDVLKSAETRDQIFVQNIQQLTDHRHTQLNAHSVSNGQLTSSSKSLPHTMIYTTAQQQVKFEAINSDRISTVSNSSFHEPYKAEGVLTNLKLNSNTTFKMNVSNKSEAQMRPLLPINITALNSQSHITKQNSAGQNTSQRKLAHAPMLVPNSRNLDQSKFHAILKSSTDNEYLSTNKLSSPKAIKTITIGKDSYAIQQTSIPLKMGSIDHQLQTAVPISIANYLQLSNLDESSMRTGKTFSEKENNKHDDIRKQLINEAEIDYGKTSQSLINSEHDSKHTNSLKCEVYTSAIPNNISRTGQEMNGKEATEFLTVKSIGNGFHLRSDTNLFVSASQSDCNSRQNENKQQKNTHYIMPKIVPIHFQVTRADPEVSTMKATLTQTNAVMTVPEKFSTIAAVPALKTLGELVPTSASVISVNAVQPPQRGNRPIISKVLVLPRTSKQKQINNSKQHGQRVTYSKKAVPKKVGRKTVRELLEERNLISSNKMDFKDEMLSNKIGVKILKPILKLAPSNGLTTVQPQIVSGYVGTALNPTKINEGNDISSNSIQSSNTQGKPNILILPSAPKSTQNSSEAINEIQIVGNKDLKTSERNISNIFPSAIFLPPFKDGIVNAKEHRPRHYDMSLLVIGPFKVEDDVDSTGRFRSKFKVLFTKRQFLYDFPVSKCNQAEWTSSPMWEQMARIVVPFQSVTALDLDNRTINLSVCTAPLIFLGRIEARSGIISSATVYNILLEKDSAWGEGIRSSWKHKVILRKRQASKLKTYLCQFDQRFLILTNLGTYASSYMNEASFSEQHLTSDNSHKTLNRYRKTMIRRLPQWDYADREGNREANEEEGLLNFNQMCSCRISCRSVRCSCVKAAKSCSEGRAVCLCNNCDNPLNILESIGMNLEFSLSDSCLFQNIYQIPKLLDYLKRVIKLSCCNTAARIQDVIPGTVLCPNLNCNERLEFSWCRGIVCCPERNPRNHCSYCGLCCFSNGRHCLTCNRCYTVTPKCSKCPICRDKVLPDKSSKNNDSTQRAVGTSTQFSKRSSKPEIILLDTSLSSKSNVPSEELVESDRFPPASFEKKNEKTTKINSNHETNPNDERPVEIKKTGEGLFMMAGTEKCEGQNSEECVPATTETGELIAKNAFKKFSNGNGIDMSYEANTCTTCSSVELSPEIEITNEVPFIKIEDCEGKNFTEYFSSVMDVNMMVGKPEKTFELLQEVSSRNEIAPEQEENVNTDDELSSLASLITANIEKYEDQSCKDFFSVAEEIDNVMGNNERTLQTSNNNGINIDGKETVKICNTAESEIPSKVPLSMADKEKYEDRKCTEYPLITTETDSVIAESERTFQSLQESPYKNEIIENYESRVKSDSDELRSMKNNTSCKVQLQADIEKCENHSLMEYPVTVAENDRVTKKSERTFQSLQESLCKTEINKSHEASVKQNANDESSMGSEMSSKVPFKPDAEKCENNSNYTQYFSTLIEVNGVIVKNERTFKTFPQTSKIN